MAGKSVNESEDVHPSLPPPIIEDGDKPPAGLNLDDLKLANMLASSGVSLEAAYGMSTDLLKDQKFAELRGILIPALHIAHLYKLGESNEGKTLKPFAPLKHFLEAGHRGICNLALGSTSAGIYRRYNKLSIIEEGPLVVNNIGHIPIPKRVRRITASLNPDYTRDSKTGQIIPSGVYIRDHQLDLAVEIEDLSGKFGLSQYNIERSLFHINEMDRTFSLYTKDMFKTFLLGGKAEDFFSFIYDVLSIDDSVLRSLSAYQANYRSTNLFFEPLLNGKPPLLIVSNSRKADVTFKRSFLNFLEAHKGNGSSTSSYSDDRLWPDQYYNRGVRRIPEGWVVKDPMVVETFNRED